MFSWLQLYLSGIPEYLFAISLTREQMIPTTQRFFVFRVSKMDFQKMLFDVLVCLHCLWATTSGQCREMTQRASFEPEYIPKTKVHFSQSIPQSDYSTKKS
jgi:hypothetical protein